MQGMRMPTCQPAVMRKAKTENEAMRQAEQDGQIWRSSGSCQRSCCGAESAAPFPMCL